MKQRLKNTDRISKTFFFLKKRLSLCVITLFLILGPFNTHCVTAQNDEVDKSHFFKLKDQGKWSYTFQVGWATNIDFTVHNTSQDYRFDSESTGINARFYSYDSREKISELEGDQANNYLITIRNQFSGFTITTGVIHDKRKQAHNGQRNTFKYEKGGMSPVILLGLHHEFNSELLKNFSVQLKTGGFLSFNKIDAVLTNESTSTKYKSNNRYRTYAGGGVVSMVVVSYQYYISKAVSISILVNGTMINGKALTEVMAINEISDKVQEGDLSVRYSSVSIGPSLGFTIVK
jgi:hypothetical protein